MPRYNGKQEKERLSKQEKDIQKAHIKQEQFEKGKIWKLINEHPKTIILNK